jgi:ANTH domain
MSKWYKLLGGEQQKRLWVLKTTSAAPGGPKPKYLRKLVAALWEGGLTLGGFFQLLRYRPLADNPIVAVKALITLMRVLQQGPPHCLMEITPYADVVDEIGQMWARSESCGSNSAGGSGSGSSGSSSGAAAAGSSGLDDPALTGAGVAPQDAAFATLICRLASAIVQKVSCCNSVFELLSTAHTTHVYVLVVNALDVSTTYMRARSLREFEPLLAMRYSDIVFCK